MKLRIVTIVLDGMPFIASHLPVFNKLGLDWEWHIAEGVAKPVQDTSWCKPIAPRLSHDGTSPYLDTLAEHPRVRIHRQPEWPGKCAQVNACCQGVGEGDMVLQVDADEIWTARQIELMARLLDSGRNQNGLLFRCRFFLGPDIVINSRQGYGNHAEYEWRRAWRVSKDFRFTKHEPPEVNFPVRWVGQEETESLGLVFDHYAYATIAQVTFKEIYYGYRNAVADWTNLQRNKTWPVKLSKFLSWVKDESTCTKL